MKTSPSSKDNMALWNKVCRTDPDNTKKMTHGAKLTTIAAHSQIQAATEQWGPCGDKWLIHPTFRERELPNGDILVFCEVGLYYGHKEPADIGHAWGARILATGSCYLVKGTRVDDEAYKKAQTDGTTKALSYLGFNADVFLNKFADPTYVEESKEHFRAQKLRESCPHANVTEAEVKASWDKMNCLLACTEMAAVVTTHTRWSLHHLLEAHPEYLTDNKPNDKLDFTYAKRLFLKVQKRTKVLHKLMQAYENRGVWLQYLELLGAEDPYALTEKQWGEVVRRIKVEDLRLTEEFADSTLSEDEYNARATAKWEKRFGPMPTSEEIKANVRPEMETSDANKA